jgi:hypothetical protein
MGADRSYVSITHTAGHAAAVVVLEATASDRRQRTPDAIPNPTFARRFLPLRLRRPSAQTPTEAPKILLAVPHDPDPRDHR